MTKALVVVFAVVVMATFITCGQGQQADQGEQAAEESQEELQSDQGKQAAEESQEELGTQSDQADDLDFSLDDLEPLEKTKELDDLGEDELKAIYLEYHAGSRQAIDRSYQSGIENIDKLIELREKLQTKNKYEVAKKYGLTMSQMDRLNVIGTQRGWAFEQ